MSAPLKVSIILTTDNHGSAVVEAIESVLAQTYRNVEVIVVDTGPTDDPEPRVAPVADPRVSYLRRIQAGVAADRNAGLAAATGTLVAFLDPDVVWKPDKLEREVAFLLRHPEAQAVFSDLEEHDGSVVVPSLMRTNPVFSKLLAGRVYPEGLVFARVEIFWCLLQDVPIRAPVVTMRREALARAGTFDASWSSSADREFLIRFARTGRFGYIDRPLAVSRASREPLPRTDREQSHLDTLRLLARECASAGDPGTRLVLRQSISASSRRLSEHYLECGQRRAAAANYVRGFLGSGDVGLLRAAAAPALPECQASLRGLARAARRRAREVMVALRPVLSGQGTAAR